MGPVATRFQSHLRSCVRVRVRVSVCVQGGTEYVACVMMDCASCDISTSCCAMRACQQLYTGMYFPLSFEFAYIGKYFKKAPTLPPTPHHQVSPSFVALPCSRLPLRFARPDAGPRMAWTLISQLHTWINSHMTLMSHDHRSQQSVVRPYYLSPVCGREIQSLACSQSSMQLSDQGSWRRCCGKQPHTLPAQRFGQLQECGFDVVCFAFPLRDWLCAHLTRRLTKRVAEVVDEIRRLSLYGSRLTLSSVFEISNRQIIGSE